ncbi:MAG TPA: tRNA pseudouridine(38-40) synthase TruA [Vicinamibacterales bacterium]|nr:tRNA pseudouridine(38-40) synthase TruA [Vicinamibacterales bacterium]
MARILKLTLQYDGTDYVGWQRQANGVSIQGLLEDAVRPIEGVQVNVFGAGRTDAGVHALGQVASLSLTAAIDARGLGRALNAVLPPDIRVVAAEEAAPDFHARFSASGKVYEYRIVNGQTVSPFVRRFVWHVIPRLDLDAMREASVALVGRHDFAAFQGVRAAVRSTERTIRRLEWSEGHGNDVPLVMHIEGNGFLRHMVRIIAGTLVEIGLGRWPAARIHEILASRDRTQAGTTAPAAGLCLRRVDY